MNPLQFLEFFILARKRTKSDEDYVKFETFQVNQIIKSFQKNNLTFKNKKLLDIACGRGGYARFFLKKGAIVAALDITDKYFQKFKGINFILGDGRKLPFKDNSFDIVFSSSTIEHITEQQKFVNELKRVLKKDGFCYLSFPPFWSPVGSHQFKPFHYFGEKIAIKLSRRFYNVKSRRYDDKYGMLYITTIKNIKRLIKRAGFSIINLSTRFSPVNFASIPVLNEFLTWHVEFLLKKK